MAAPARHQSLNFKKTDASRDFSDSLRAYASESSMRSTAERPPILVVTPAQQPDLPARTACGTPAVDMVSSVQPAPPDLPILQAASFGGDDSAQSAALAKQNPIFSSSSYPSYPLCVASEGSIVATSETGASKPIAYGLSSRPIYDEIIDDETDTEDEGVYITVLDSKKQGIRKKPEKKVVKGKADSGRNVTKAASIDKPAPSNQDKAGDLVEEAPAPSPVAKPKASWTIVETADARIFESQEHFEEYARGRINAAHPKVTLELKRSPHTVTISCRNRRKEYTSCPFLLRGREELGPNGHTRRYKLAKSGEDEVIGHNAACLARLNERTASQSASKNTSPSETPKRPALTAATEAKACKPIQTTTAQAIPSQSNAPALPPTPSRPVDLTAVKPKKKRTIVIDSSSEGDEPVTKKASLVASKEGVASSDSDLTESEGSESGTGTSSSESDYETPAQLRKRKANHPGNVLPSRARRYRPAYYGL